MAERKAKTEAPEKENQEVKKEEVQQTLSERVVNIRTLKANEIECRIGTINEKGCTLLLYKDARVDMRLLDEVFGPMNWKRDHEVVNGNLFCTISIYDEKKKEWVSKQDVGTESNTEKEKGQASDAFKRAGFNWGIGRELYSAPFIWIKLEPTEISKSTSGRCSTYTKFSVSEIEYDENREVSKCIIVDNNGVIRYQFPKPKEQQKSMPEQPQQNSSVFSGKQLQDAIYEVRACRSRAEVNAVWKKHAAMQNNLEFKNEIQMICKRFPK